MRKLIALLALLLALPAAAQTVLWTNVDPDGTACGDPPAPQVLIYVPTGGSTSEQWCCNTSTNLWFSCATGGGGSTTPGGSTTQVQYNSSGSFAGDSGMTTDGAGTIDVSTQLDVARLTLNECDQYTDIPSDNIGLCRSATGGDFAANGALILMPRTAVASDVEIHVGTSPALAFEVQGDGDVRAPNLTTCANITTDGTGVLTCGDFSGAADLEASGALSIDVVAAAEMADADHGDVSWSSGVATVENLQCTDCVGTGDIDLALTPTWTGEHAYQDFVTIEQGIRHDWDGDNSYERVTAYDFDGDNTLEMSDLDSIIDAVCPSGTCPEEGITLDVISGNWAAPSANINTDGLLELPSNFTLQCHGGATLNGCAIANDATCNDAIIAVRGQDKVRVDGCHLKGGATGSDNLASSAGPSMGIEIKDDGVSARSTNVWFTNNFVELTVHTGIYAKNADGVVIANNIVDQAGTWGNAGAWSQPCVYIFADSGYTMENFVISNNVLKRCQSNGINFRRNSTAAGDTIQFGFGVGNVINDVGSGQYCLQMGGSYNTGFFDTTCVAGKAFQYPGNDGNTEYWDDGTPANDNATRNSVIDGFGLYDADAETGALAEVGDYHDGVALRGVVIYGDGTSGQDGISLRSPQRRLEIDGIEIVNVGRYGMLYPGTGNTAADEVWTIRNSRIVDPGDDLLQVGSSSPLNSITWDGFFWQSGASSSNGTIRNLSGTGDWTDLTWRNGWLDCNDSVQDGFRMDDADAARLTWENVRFQDCESSYGISFETTGECNECSFATISGIEIDSANMQGAISLNSVGDDLQLTNIWCDGTAATEGLCVNNIPASADVQAANVENELATEDTGYQVAGTGGPTWTSGTATPGTCTAGSLFSDTDGDGTTNCSGGTAACYLAVCGPANTWYYPAD